MRARPIPSISSESGIALMLVLLLLMLTSAVLTGFLMNTTTDVRLRSVDRSRTQAFYAAHAGLEKLTSDLGDLFSSDFSPEMADLTAIEAEPPELLNTVFEANDGLGYKVTPSALDEFGNPKAEPGTITGGLYDGFMGMITDYTMTATAHMVDGSEARLERTIKTVGIPVFQFGVFSETDLTFSANGTFSFGGRVHTNGNLFLSAASGGSLYLAEKVTVVREVVRSHLANGRSVSGTHDSTVYMAKATGSYRALALNEGSLNVSTAPGDWINTPVPASKLNSKWLPLYGTYNGYIRNYKTGVKRLDLPLITVGSTPIELIKRQVPGEANLVAGQRMYTQAQIRILLSDTMAQITGLPGVSAGNPLELNLPAGYAPQQGPPFRARIARSPGTADAAMGSAVYGTKTPTDTPLIGGFLKVEYRNAADAWTDVTLEWLNLGVTRRNIDRPTQQNANNVCAEPNPDAILRVQRVRQNTAAWRAAPGTMGNLCVQNALSATEYWPLVLYDIREGYNRDNLAEENNNPCNGTACDGSELYMAGVIHYLDLDVNNLRRWLLGTIGASGPQVVNEDGFALYFSDRRTNRDGAGNPTGEFGWEDFVNPASATGTPNGSLDDGEDVNSNTVRDIYGATAISPTGAWVNFLDPFTSTADPRRLISPAAGNWPNATYPNGNFAGDQAHNRARVNPTLFFRRALKVSNGVLGNLPADGLTVISENPVYVEGHYNAGPAAWGTTGAPAAIIADSVTILSANWSLPLQVESLNGAGTYWIGHGDTRSLLFPNSPGRRVAATATYYRFAVLSGKGRNWTQSGTPASFGTDGGVHNFMKLTESWTSKTLNYRGSIASFFFARQNVGLFRCCDNVYHLPTTRNLSFDTNFLNPALLPPKTPMFRDVNTTGFNQVTRRQ